MELNIEDIYDYSSDNDNYFLDNTNTIVNPHIISKDSTNDKKNENNDFYQNKINEIIQTSRKKKSVHFSKDDSTKHLRDGSLCKLKKGYNAPVHTQEKPFSYDDILAKIGVINNNGNIHLRENSELLIDSNVKNVRMDADMATKKSSYIYNKYFQNEISNQSNQIKRPRTLAEYQNMLVQTIIEKKKVELIKSRKLIMPTSNIHFSNSSNRDLNKLFTFSQR